MQTIRIFQESDVTVNVKEIVSHLNKICKFLKFVSGESRFEISESVISHPTTFNNLSADIINETRDDYKAIFITQKRYDNNYFFQIAANRIILTFFGWEHLTNLSVDNGLVFFIADIVALSIDHSRRHDDNPRPECIYDFGWNKAGVDIGMRSSMICPYCLEQINKKQLPDAKKQLLSDLQLILNDLGNASKWETDIVAYWKVHTAINIPPGEVRRDRVFISYSHSDSEWLRRLKTQFKPFERTAVVQIWDDTKIGTGDDWRKSVEEALKTTKVAVLLVSPDFLASDYIANEELPKLLEAARNEGAVIMPIILKPCAFDKIPSISKFQAVNPPSKTLADMTEGEQERILLKLTEDVLGALAR